MTEILFYHLQRQTIEKVLPQLLEKSVERDWRVVVQAASESLSFYQAELRPVLEHLLAARLAERHGVHLYDDPEAARRLLCLTSRDADLWRWIDPATRPPSITGRGATTERGIPRRTLTRLVDRLERL